MDGCESLRFVGRELESSALSRSNRFDGVEVQLELTTEVIVRVRLRVMVILRNVLPRAIS